MTSSDKDFRFMATNDLMSELQKDSIKLDDDSERKVVKMLLRLLEDKNGEVQNLAVKCLGPLVNKVKEYQVETVVDALCNNMLSEKEQLRDISSIGLKTVICELPLASGPLAASVCKRITGRLTSAIAKEDVSVQLEALDILGDLLSRFGGLLVTFHSTILEALLPQLASPRQAVRKRTIIACGHLVMACSHPLYVKLIDFLLEQLARNESTSTTRTYIQCVAAICRQAGHRFGEHLERVMPLVVQYSRLEDDELRENCLQACEAFVHKCPEEVAPHLGSVIQLCLEYLTYDPNYNYDDDEDDSGGAEGMDTEEDGGGGPGGGEDEDDDEYSDDDDLSWKVRRAAAKCLEAVVSTRREMLPDFYRLISPVLISRFKEREENVKSDIFHAYVALLKQTRHVMGMVPMHMPAPAPESVDVDMYLGTYIPPKDSSAEDNPVVLLQRQVPQMVRAVHRQMREKSSKTRQGCFALLTELVLVLPGALADHLSALVPGVQLSLGEKNVSSNMKIDTLAFLHVLMTSHAPEVFHPHVHQLLPPIIGAVNDSFYKITSEALLVLQQLVRVIRPLVPKHHTQLSASQRLQTTQARNSFTVSPQVEATDPNSPGNFDFTPFTRELYQCTLVRLKAADIDQEVKERAISCMGQIICNLGDHLQDELPTFLPLFLDRLRNEITRLTTVKALTKIAGSPLRIDLRPIMSEAVPILASFLRKNQRALKLSTLTLLDTLVKNYSNALNTEMLDKVLIELPPLLNESDLHIAQMTLTLLTSIARLHRASVRRMSDAILPEIMVLVRSPLLQGGALLALLEFFQALVTAGLPGLSHAELLAQLIAPIVGGGAATPTVGAGGAASQQQTVHKQAYHSIAKCVAALTMAQKQEALGVVHRFLQELMSPGSDSQHIFALLAIGEIGRHTDLSTISELRPAILASFSPPSEEVKAAASYALGSVAVGNLPNFLPFVLEEIQRQPRRQYLLLHSLKEIISCQSASPAGIQQLQGFVGAIWERLFEHCECGEEGTRNVVAECLGKLTLIDPPTLLPRLKADLASRSALRRTTVVTAMKFTISDQTHPIDPLLRMCIGDFLNTLQDPDLNVRRVALVAFNSAAHNKPSLVRDLLDSMLPQLYAETRVRKELIREVEMGPFKHTVDDGLDIRKAAFECMYTLLDSCLDRLDVFEFLTHVEDGLKDHYDIKMLTYLMVARLAQLCPVPVLQRLERLVEPLRITCTTKVKANSVKQEFEKQDELKRSAMRAVAALLSIPDADKNPQLNEFVSQIKSSPDLQALFESIQKDSVPSQESLAMDLS